MIGPVSLPPIGMSLDTPSVARVYDYCLGGTTNWELDRSFVDPILDRYPLVRRVAAMERLYLNRVVRFLLGRGVRQFLDIGSGVPGRGSTPAIVADWIEEHENDVDARVVCVDNDPLAVAHGKVEIEFNHGGRKNAMVRADLRDPDALWRTATGTGLIDPGAPVALLLIAVLHIRQRDASGAEVTADAVAHLRDLLPADSYVAVSQVSDAEHAPGTKTVLDGLREVYDGAGSEVAWRTRDEIQTTLDGCRVEEPGWTTAGAWRPEQTGIGAPLASVGSAADLVTWTGVGRKR